MNGPFRILLAILVGLVLASVVQGNWLTVIAVVLLGGPSLIAARHPGRGGSR